MRKITYLFGAGASYYAFPLSHGKGKVDDDLDKSSDLASDIGRLGHRIKSDSTYNLFQGFDLRSEGEKETLNKAADLLIEVSEMGMKYDSIDLLAKYYFEKGEDKKFLDVKAALDVYFYIQNHLENVNDERYLRFLISILSNQKFPNSINILTWNYDMLMENALSHFGLFADGYLPNKKIDKITSFPLMSEEDVSNPRIIHLNGIAGRPFNNVLQKHLYTGSKEIEEYILRLREILGNRTNESLISFGFEPNRGPGKANVDLKKLIRYQTQRTDVLVVIGYSFPFFNRITDREILSNLLSNQNLVIYIQNPNFDIPFFRTQFEISGSIRIEHVEDCNNFFIPFQFEA